MPEESGALAAFNAALDGPAETAAVETPAAETTVTEATTTEQARDELGRFMARAAEQAASTTTEGEQGATAEDSFTQFDPNSVPEELRAQAEALYKSFQGDYTRKMQAVAEQRKQIEALGDINSVQQAVEHVYLLNTNPEYAKQFQKELSDHLQQQGLTVAQANAAATQQVQEQAAQGTDDFSDPQIQALESQIQELRQWQAQQMQAVQQQQLLNEIQAQETAIRSQYPHFKQDDIDAIYNMSFSPALAAQGPAQALKAAAESYATLQQRLISDWVAEKQGVPAAAPAAVTTSQELPAQMTDRERSRAIKERLLQELPQ